ncbi:MAG: GNAT family N-acetyltransferase [Massiliimalia sp.]|jgi:ribosomal protein S18 acetylase RimI-like enzyme
MKPEIPDKNLFMMCPQINLDAMAPLPQGFTARLCRPEDLLIWKRIHFDDPKQAEEFSPFMDTYFEQVYSQKQDLFFSKCLLICAPDGQVVGTCFAWKAYDAVTTIHWFKVLPAYENHGIGRGLLSMVMSTIEKEEYPVYLHTQPSSYRAIKLYTDFGFQLLTDPIIGNRENHVKECLPILKCYMTPSAYENLSFAKAPESFLKVVASSPIDQF